MLPLNVFIDDYICPIRPTCDAGKRDCPVAEIFAPTGMVFSGGETSLLVHTEHDIDVIVQGEFLVKEDATSDDCDYRTMGTCMACRDMLPPGYDVSDIHRVWASFGEEFQL